MIMKVPGGSFDRELSEAELEQIARLMAEHVRIHNTSPDPELGGLSPDQVMRLSYWPWGEPGSPMQCNAGLTLEACERSSFFRRARTFLLAVREAGGVKATNTKNLNRAFVAEMMNVLLTDEERGEITRRYKAPNEEMVHRLFIVRLVAGIAGVLQLRKGMFSVPRTKAGLLEPGRAGELFRELFLANFVKFNLACLARFGPDAESLQTHAGYTLCRLGVVAADWKAVEGLQQEVLLPAVRRELEAETSGMMFGRVGGLLEWRLLQPLLDWGMLEGRFEYGKSRHFQTLVSVRVTALYREFLNFELSWGRGWT